MTEYLIYAIIYAIYYFVFIGFAIKIFVTDKNTPVCDYKNLMITMIVFQILYFLYVVKSTIFLLSYKYTLGYIAVPLADLVSIIVNLTFISLIYQDPSCQYIKSRIMTVITFSTFQLYRMVLTVFKP